MSYIGIGIGAVAVKVVRIEAGGVSCRSANHKGRPGAVLADLLRDLPPARAYGVCGHLGHIGEAQATNAALAEVGGEFDAVASLGGETFTVYLVEGGRIASALAHNQCAAGSGEFLVQQVGRLALTMDEAIEQSFAGQVVPMACRCSVHCKSDVTHKLNRKEASVADILRTLHDGMAGKVVSLLERARRPVRRLLLAGGLVRNRAMVAALREKLPGVDVVVLPESECLEAFGAALIARDNPVYDRPRLADRTVLGHLPPLAAFEGQVVAMTAPQADPRAPGPFVLGLDAGSTTTKTVLLEAATGAVAARHYRRTNGDPVEAARQCLRAMAAQAGDRPVSLSATTGSARELVGAYLGTAHVYNEISAHAAGAARFDPDVDTLFEIGGQDAKYVLLRHGVPIDYAMNASCSAGTGSFLEECALGDLALPLEEISAAALRAREPVQFKATCAAFMNSDIRRALQEGRSRDDVAAGLAYAVVGNYLAKVKGPRAVGKRVFFQGGLAVNHAVACAMAQALGKRVIIPPHPELLGACGAALLAIERAGEGTSTPSTLSALASPPLRTLGHFTCAACANRCTIDRFEVAGRQFPFGGRCSRFENRGRAARPPHVPDLVEQRNALVFAEPASPPDGTPALGRLGIPRALTVHSLFPLYATFFRRLGLEVVLSGVDPVGPLKANSAFCFPVQIAHGAVLDLVRQGLHRIFLPQVARMPNPLTGRDSYLCPVAQASPYVIAKAFPGVAFLSPVLNFAGGYLSCQAMTDLAVSQLHVPPQAAQQAWHEAVGAQQAAEQAMLRLGRDALAAVLAEGRPAVLLVGRSYNAFPPEASQSVARKLASMGVRVIPGDCLPQETPGPTAWHYPNLILNAVALARRHPNLFVLYVSNFSCTVDAFTHSFFAAQLADKPYLLLEIDAHTADAGVQTRLEAFWDIVGNYHADAAPPTRPHRPAAIGNDAVVTTSTGERVSLRDPRVKIHFPAFSHYHSRAVALVGQWLGLHVASPPELTRAQLERGLRYTSGRECLPLPVCLGQMLDAHDARRNGDVVGFYMVRGGAPCVVDCYGDYFRQFIRDNALGDLFLFDPAQANNYYGLSPLRMSRYLAPVFTLADLFVEMEQALGVVGGPEALPRLRDAWDRHVARAPSLWDLKNALAALIDRIAAIPHASPARCPRVAVTGDFFLRFSPCFMEGVHERYARNGVILVPVGLNELLLYGAYTEMAGTARDWLLPPDSGRTVAAAFVRLFRPEGRDYLENWAQYRWLKRYDDRYRRLFARTGLLTAGVHDVARLFDHAAGHLSTTIVGEAIPTVGKAVAAGQEGYDGLIAVGPFNCLPFRVSEAILKPFGWADGMPILTYESDGFSVPPAFFRQVDVHVQQVLARHAAR